MRFNWSSLEYWKKGFILGVLLHLLYFLIFIPWIISGGGESTLGWIFAFTDMLVFVLIFPFLESLADSATGLFIIGLMMTVFFGVVGALIGLIVNKIKSKK